MSCTIYTRVSSMRQTYNNSISLQAQEDMCRNYASKMGLLVNGVRQEVHSVFHKTPPILGEIINGKSRQKNIILCVAVDRFSRSTSVGVNMAKVALSNNHVLKFIREDFICDSFRRLSTLVEHLKQAEGESAAISSRVKSARNYLENIGIFTGAQAPYGFVVRDRKLVPNQSEQLILSFIRLCKQDKIMADELNALMSGIVKATTNVKYNPIDCYNKKNEIVTIITEKLLNTEIAALLNSYKVTKRGREWDGPIIARALKSNKKYYHLNLTSKQIICVLRGDMLPNVATDNPIVLMDTSSDNDIDIVAKKRKFADINYTNIKQTVKRRRSPRLAAQPSPEDRIKMQKLDHMSSLVDTDLLAQFREFVKMQHK